MAPGARRVADVDAAHLRALNAGSASCRTLSEALAIDQSALVRAVVPDAGPALLAAVDAAAGLGILKRMQGIGRALTEHLPADRWTDLAAHPSDTVRGWACFHHAARPAAGPEELLERIRPAADDEHFSVREWAWMAVRPHLVPDLDASIVHLAGWTADPSERVRRFASESLRPRGVWASHIAVLKEEPERGEPILDPLRADPSRSVQDSVGNWINDAAKTRPDWARGLATRWRSEAPDPLPAQTARILTRGLRSLPA